MSKVFSLSDIHRICLPIAEKHVDVVTTTCNDKEFVKKVMKEAILIYESKDKIIIQKILQYCKDVDGMINRFGMIFKYMNQI